MLYFSTILIISFLLNVNVYHYISNTLEIIKQYNDGNVIPAPRNMLLYAVLVILIYLFAVFINSKKIIFNKERLFKYGFVSGSLFIIFKDGFVRADLHMFIFFFSAIPLISLLYFFENEEKIKKQLFHSILMIAIISNMAFQVYTPSYDPILTVVKNIKKIPYRDLVLGEFQTNFISAMKRGKENAKFSDRILEKLKGKTIDIFPWDISYIFFNNIDYEARPCMQSFNVASKRLDELNSEKLVSESSPDYLMYAIGSIDDRHPFWDESITKLTMLTHYEVNDTVVLKSESYNSKKNEFILLKKRQYELKMVEIASNSIIYEIGDTLKIPTSDNLLYLYADFQYSFFGKIRRLLYQPKRISAEIFYDNSESSFNIAVIPILKNGVLINKKVITFEDAYTFFESQGRNNTDVTYVRFLAKQHGFRDKVKITLKEYKVE